MKTPYTYRVSRRPVGTPEAFDVFFELGRIRTVSGLPEVEIRDMVFLLNTAYDQGYCEGVVEEKRLCLTDLGLG